MSGLAGISPPAGETTLLSVLDRQIRLDNFNFWYDELVETLCEAARLGPVPTLNVRYLEAKEKVDAGYRQLRPFLRCYLDLPSLDEQVGLKLGGRPLDAFETLVAAADLADFLKMDDGSMISRITKTREAVTLYREHLRLLVAKAA